MFRFDTHYPNPSRRMRRGRLTTPHGIIETPAFIFCATKAAIKGVPAHWLAELNTQIILSNTYHLFIQPQAKTVKDLGGLHKFMGWQGPMLTDSGGFQIFSLGHGSVGDEIKGKRLAGGRKQTLLKITEEGAAFRSYRDGSRHILTPEASIQTQIDLGADLIVVFDECTPFHVERAYTEASMERSHRWELRSLQEFQRQNITNQALYGIIQGGIYPDLRTRSTAFVNNHPFFGHAIGGSLGGTREQMNEIVRLTACQLDPVRPIHLLGIGGVRDIFTHLEWGIDTFDCVHPTRIARHGGALHKRHPKEHINLKNSQYRNDPSPIEADCGCPTCTRYTRGYLHHLIKAEELIAATLITLHNIYFMNQMMIEIRKGIEEDTFEAVRDRWIC